MLYCSIIDPGIFALRVVLSPTKDLNMVDTVRSILLRGLGPDVPFTNMRRGISILFQHIGDCRHSLESKTCHVIGKCGWVSACHKSSSRRIARHPRYMKIPIQSPLSCESVEIWGLSVGVTIAGKVTESQIVLKDEDDVGTIVSRRICSINSDQVMLIRRYLLAGSKDDEGCKDEKTKAERQRKQHWVSKDPTVASESVHTAGRVRDTDREHGRHAQTESSKSEQIR